MDNTKHFVVLEHLMLPDRGFRFITTNCNWSGRTDPSPNDNNTHGYNGELWYKEVAFADTIEEAQSMLSPNSQAIPTSRELEEYYRMEESEKEFRQNMETFDFLDKTLNKSLTINLNQL